jgi:hypothetical protein
LILSSADTGGMIWIEGGNHKHHVTVTQNDVPDNKAKSEGKGKQKVKVKILTIGEIYE